MKGGIAKPNKAEKSIIIEVVERVIWIEILGLPCCTRNDSAVNKVACIWGELCFLDDDNQAPLAIKRVCIKTAQPSLIQDKLSLVVQGIKYDVVVRELLNWEPNILCNEDAIDCDLPSLTSDLKKDVNDFDDGVAEEEGEMTPKGKLKSIDMENDNSIDIEQEYDLLKSDAHMRSSISVPIDAPLGGPIDVNADQIGVVGSGTVLDVPIATVACPTVEVGQGLGDDNVSDDSLSHPPGFRRDVELNPGTSKMKSNSASSHVSSRLLKKRVSDNIEDISDIMNQYVEMGRFLGYDMEGNKDKVKSLCVQNRVSFLGLQETRMTQLDLFKVRSMWGNCSFHYAFSTARGRSKGILSIWDPNIFKKNSIVCSSNVVIVRGFWVPFNMECCMVNVYAPQDIIEKRLLWNYISSFITR
uniref:RNA-directed DNA polymerase, eukaryota n=1 Tax=Lactuca sativa TaxID=4236 RepID=A0A9R1VT78_LACSA|nr:hypothetical protein LSAT_V11C400171530 [Lactuca sativa]